jgi:hypothetical protein
MQQTLQKKTAQISAIIEKRRPIVCQIEAVEQHLQVLSDTLYALKDQCATQKQKAEDIETSDRLDQLNMSSLQTSIQNELQTLDKLKKRFSRDTLNIGVIGRARQGKSRLLQSLSGLTADEIPDGDRQHCTGVRSTICHQPTLLNPYAQVWFYSEQSFLDDIIAPYYKALGLGRKPSSLKDFKQQLLPPLPGDRAAHAESGAQYEHLKRYHDFLDKYAHLLGSPPKNISREEIRSYVAQDTPDGERIYFNYLAIREVKIMCLFPNEEVGQIALVDMPGLGDTGVGDADRLVKALGQDVDVVLFVRMPNTKGDFWAEVDVQLYDIACKALPMLPLSLWSFLVLNRTSESSKNGDNWNNCKDLAESLSEKHIEVVQQITANCADNRETEALLDSILQYMTDNIAQLDRQYARSCQESLYQLQQAVEAELEKAQQALGYASSQEDWHRLFEPLYT